MMIFKANERKNLVNVYGDVYRVKNSKDLQNGMFYSFKKGYATPLTLSQEGDKVIFKEEGSGLVNWVEYKYPKEIPFGVTYDLKKVNRHQRSVEVLEKLKLRKSAQENLYPNNLRNYLGENIIPYTGNIRLYYGKGAKEVIETALAKAVCHADVIKNHWLEIEYDISYLTSNLEMSYSERYLDEVGGLTFRTPLNIPQGYLIMSSIEELSIFNICSLLKKYPQLRVTEEANKNKLILPEYLKENVFFFCKNKKFLPELANAKYMIKFPDGTIEKMSHEKFLDFKSNYEDEWELLKED